jgi:hypothetical protein
MAQTGGKRGRSAAQRAAIKSLSLACAAHCHGGLAPAGSEQAACRQNAAVSAPTAASPPLAPLNCASPRGGSPTPLQGASGCLRSAAAACSRDAAALQQA